MYDVISDGAHYEKKKSDTNRVIIGVSLVHGHAGFAGGVVMRLAGRRAQRRLVGRRGRGQRRARAASAAGPHRAHQR